jgi:hypothetical protein
MEETQNDQQPVVEQGFTGAPDVVRRPERRPQQQVNLTLPIIVAAAVVVVIVGTIVLARGKTARWHTYTSSPVGIAALSVSLDIPPEWRTEAPGTAQTWGIRIVRAAPEERLARGETKKFLGTELQVTCSKIPQEQTLDQYMEALGRSSATGLTDVQPCTVGSHTAFRARLRQAQQQELLYVSPEGSGVMYVLRLACLPDEYEVLKPTFDRVIQSFRVGG